MEGFDPDDERASVDGPVPASMSYNDWLKSQPEDVQIDVLGPTRFEAFRNGLDISSFVADGKKLTLTQLMENEGLVYFGAGLKDKSWQARDAYAETYYETIRNRREPTDISKIANNTDFSRDEIRSIRNHIFINEHDLYEGERGQLATDWRIAQAWQRMEQGWQGNGMRQYHDVDILLLRHELEELTLMADRGYTVEEAHRFAKKKYPWDIAIKELE